MVEHAGSPGSASEPVDVSERLRGAKAPRLAEGFRERPHPLVEGGALPIVRLARVRVKCRELAVEGARDVDDEVRLGGPEEQDAADPVMRPAAAKLRPEEEVIARGDHAVEADPAGDAVVRVRLVCPPGVGTDDEIGLLVPDHAADLAAERHRHFELAVVMTQEDALLDAEDLRRGALLVLARARDAGRGRLQVMRSLVAAREQAVHDGGTFGRPRRDRTGTPEVGIVGMREDDQRAARNLKAHVRVCETAAVLDAPWAPTVLVALALYAMLLAALVVAGRRTAARELALLVPNLLLFFRGLLGDPRVPRRAKIVLAIAAAWIASPIDLVPEFVPVAGPLDDAIVAALALRYVVSRTGREVVSEHWRGEPATLEVLLRIARVR